MTISVSGLPLLAYKVGPNLFDLSSNLHYVSMRDQMHRAVALAEALVDGQQFKESNQVLIVGAGVAGVSAGIVLARHGVEVLMVDAAMNAPFALQRNTSERFVGPYMYEWPLEVYSSQVIPPGSGGVLSNWDTGRSPPLQWPSPDPGRPDQLVKEWDKNLRAEMALRIRHLRLLTGINQSQAQLEISRWLSAQRDALKYRNCMYSSEEIANLGGVPWSISSAPSWPIRPRFVILAAGMGAERHVLNNEITGEEIARGVPFWSDDRLLRPNCGVATHSSPRVVILGGGDGALQDTLRALTGDEHPLKTWQKLTSKDKTGALAAVQARVIAFEYQNSQMTIWAGRDAHGGAVDKPLDESYQELARDLAKDRALADTVCRLLRSDVYSVRLCIRDGHFGKAYALNRFMVHLFEQCLQRHGNSHNKVLFEVCREFNCVDSVTKGTTISLKFDNGGTLDADVVVVRAGVDASMHRRTWLGLDTRDSVNRQDLSKVPLPLYFPPSR